VSTPRIENGEPLSAAWVFLTARGNVWCAAFFASRCSVPEAGERATGADAICACSSAVSECSTRGAEMSTGGAGMTACASAGGGTGSSATPAVSAGAGVSGGVERSMTASNISATPAGSAIHPPLRKAETIGSTNCWTREGARESMAVTAPCRAIAISLTLGSHRAMMLCLTTRSRALPKTRNAAAIDKLTRCVPFRRPAEKPRLSRQSYPKPTYSDVAGQVVFIDPRGSYGWACQGVMLHAAWGCGLSPAVAFGVNTAERG